MPTHGQQPEALTAVLTPKGFEEAVLCTGAEYVETRSASSGAVLQRLIVIPDEDERRRQVESDDTLPDVRKLHSRKLEELRWARDQVLSDPRLQSFLPSTSNNLWPSAEALQTLGKVVAFLKEHADAPPDRQGALSLLRALRVLEAESSHPGVYTLREVPLEGSLALYDMTETTELVPGATTASTGDTAASANVIPSQLERSAAPFASAKPLLLDVSAVLPVGALDAAEARLSPASQAALLHHLGVAAAAPDKASLLAHSNPAKQWAEVIHAHRRSLLDKGAPLFMDVQDAVQTLGLSEVTLAALMHRAAATHNQQVRLRVGVFATVIHLAQVRCVFLGKKEDQLTNEEQEAIRSATMGSETVHVLTCPASDPVFTGNRARLDAIVKSNFTSPLLKTLSACATTTTDLVATIGPAIRVVHVCVAADPLPAGNPFVVVHGSRVVNGFQGNAQVVAHLKRQRQEVLDQLTEETRLAAFRGTPSGGSGATQRATPSVTVGGGAAQDARAQIHRSVVQVLSGADHPLSKKEISQHPTFITIRQHPSFDRMLADALEAVAESVARKYVLK